MAQKNHNFSYEWLEGLNELNIADQALLQKAREATVHAYAPYSNFRVAAVARLSNGETLAATNQENASYPVGICAERTLLSALSSVYPNQPVETIAISYVNGNGGFSGKPATPCGICRQSLLEFEQRTGKPLRIIMTGTSGPVMIISSAADLLPFGFGPDDLKGDL